jgi:hypothetical protein
MALSLEHLHCRTQGCFHGKRLSCSQSSPAKIGPPRLPVSLAGIKEDE